MTDPHYWTLHEEACARGEMTYVDPQSGYVVFTKLGLLERRKCCGAGCRHCPFDHESVAHNRRVHTIQQPAWMTAARPDPSCQHAILFWSGGKDSFLAYRAMQREGRFDVVLLTTFDARTRLIAHQEFLIDEVVTQAQKLHLPLIGVPLHAGADYVEQLVPAFDLLPHCEHLAFGDLHLGYVRKWREEAFAAHARTASVSLEFPLWLADYDDLLADLEASSAVCEISAMLVDLPDVNLGDRFDADLVAKLPHGVDSFGEDGEFHTRIVLP